MPDAVAERVAALVLPAVTGAGASLYDVEHTGGVVRVVVDRPDGIGLDDLGDLTRALSHLLDEADPVSGRYTLEVSSPGLERRLRTAAHFAGAVGEAVKIKLRPGTTEDRRLAGTVVGADDDSVTVRLAGDGAGPGDERRVALDDIEQARTVFEWGPGPRSGAGSGRSHPQREKKAAS